MVFHIFYGYVGHGYPLVMGNTVEIKFDNLKIETKSNGLRSCTFDTDYYTDLTVEWLKCVSVISDQAKSDVYFVDSLSKNDDTGIWTYNCVSIATRLLASEDYLVYNQKSKWEIITDVLKLAGIRVSTLPDKAIFDQPDGTNPFDNKFSAIFDGETYLNIFLGILRSVPLAVYLDFTYDSIILLPHNDWHLNLSVVDPKFFNDHIIKEDITLGASNVETEAKIRPETDALTSAAEYTSMDLLGVDLSLYWPHFHKLFGSVEPKKLSGSGSADYAGFDKNGLNADHSQVLGIGRPTTGCNSGGLSYQWYKSIYKNYCPRCGVAGALTSHGIYTHMSGKDDTSDTEITCTESLGGCGADYSSPDGNEKSGACNSNWVLRRLKGPDSSSIDEWQSVTNGDWENLKVKTDTNADTGAVTTSIVAKTTEEIAADKDKKTSVVKDITDTKTEAMLSMGDSIKDFVSLNITIPGSSSEIMIDKWLYMILPTDYLLKNLSDIYTPVSTYYPLANKTPYEANWWYISNITINYSISGFTTDIEIRLLPESNSNYIKIFSKALKAYVDAENAATGADANVSVGTGTVNEVCQRIAAKYASQCNTVNGCGKCGAHSGSTMSLGFDCYQMSDAIMADLKAAGISGRISWYLYNGKSNHRSVQIKQGDSYIPFPYRDLGFDSCFNNDDNHEWNPEKGFYATW